jgi:hypothetical protein
LTTFNRLVGLRKDSVSAHHGAVPDPEPTYALIARATTLFSFDEAEVDVFRGGYTCSQSDTGTWHIAAPTELLGRAFELGYIGSAQQELLQRRGPPTPGHALLSEVAKEFARLCKEFFRVVDGPPRRIRLEMHTDVASETGYSRETRFIRKSSSG